MTAEQARQLAAFQRATMVPAEERTSLMVAVSEAATSGRLNAVVPEVSLPAQLWLEAMGYTVRGPDGATVIGWR